jgi:hypothetical protein
MATLRTVRFSLAILPLFLASIFPPSIQGSPARIDDGLATDREFMFGFELFYAGPEWFLDALPGSTARTRTTSLFIFDRSGDRVQYEAAYIGTLHNVFDVNLFSNAVPFARSSAGPTPDGPLLVLSTTYTWSTTTTATSWLNAAN